MGFKFVSHYLFFLTIKRLKLKQMSLQLSAFNYFIISWVFLLIFVNMLCSISRLFFAPLVENRLIGNTN